MEKLFEYFRFMADQVTGSTYYILQQISTSRADSSHNIVIIDRRPQVGRVLEVLYGFHFADLFSDEPGRLVETLLCEYDGEDSVRSAARLIHVSGSDRPVAETEQS